MPPETPSNEELLAQLMAVQAQFMELESRLRDTRKENEWLQDNLKKRTRELNERVKELHCLYQLSHIFDDTSAPVGEIVQKLIDSLPRAWQFAERACARGAAGGREFKTANWGPTDIRTSEEIFVRGRPAGFVEVGYLRGAPKDAAFLAEERDLLRETARRLGKMFEERGLPA